MLAEVPYDFKEIKQALKKVRLVVASDKPDVQRAATASRRSRDRPDGAVDRDLSWAEARRDSLALEPAGLVLIAGQGVPSSLSLHDRVGAEAEAQKHLAKPGPCRDASLTGRL